MKIARLTRRFFVLTMVLLWVGLPAWSSPVLRKESYLIYTGELASMMV